MLLPKIIWSINNADTRSDFAEVRIASDTHRPLMFTTPDKIFEEVFFRKIVAEYTNGTVLFAASAADTKHDWTVCEWYRVHNSVAL